MFMKIFILFCLLFLQSFSNPIKLYTLHIKTNVVQLEWKIDPYSTDCVIINRSVNGDKFDQFLIVDIHNKNQTCFCVYDTIQNEINSVKYKMIVVLNNGRRIRTKSRRIKINQPNFIHEG
jgi:hypothetical protein